MKRDIQKAIAEYDRRRDKTGYDTFTVDDITQITDMLKGEKPQEAIIKAVTYSLKAGYIVGHRAGKREATKK